MKRNLDLIVKILETVESTDDNYGWNLQVEDYDFPTVAYHAELLTEAGFLLATIVKDDAERVQAVWPRRLTWDGCEFLDLARNNKIWQKSKKLLGEKAISISVAILTELMKSLAKDILGLPGPQYPQ
jgi:hypothetical protein